MRGGMAGLTGGSLMGLRFGNGEKIAPKRAQSDKRVRKSVTTRYGTLQVRANVTRGYLEKLEARQRARDLQGIQFRAVSAGTLPASVLAEYDDARVEALLARCSRNAAAMELDQEAELFS